jgi:hypothetical protein|tara:strand:+ start:879 stop:1109 length:231 start_codon:yes stop_codon:yes gene_type:complete
MSDIYFAKNVGNVIRIVDAMTGVTAGQISVRGDISRGREPIVQGDTCTYMAVDPNGKTYGYVHKVPSGQLLRQFTI